MINRQNNSIRDANECGNRRGRVIVIAGALVFIAANHTFAGRKDRVCWKKRK
jgi:hypothetical protein